ncbi:MAG: hypothetical protein M3Q65_04920 [Chloroflexota bacterium]|nr:hypothetical protein [Chloroflexota bacterium]
MGGPKAFRTWDWTVPADALPEGLASIGDHESARAFVARHYPIPVEWSGQALEHVLALVVQHIALGEQSADGTPPPLRRIDAILANPSAAARLLPSEVIGRAGTLESTLQVVGQFYGKRWTDWP